MDLDLEGDSSSAGFYWGGLEEEGLWEGERGGWVPRNKMISMNSGSQASRASMNKRCWCSDSVS